MIRVEVQPRTLCLNRDDCPLLRGKLTYYRCINCEIQTKIGCPFFQEAATTYYNGGNQ